MNSSRSSLALALACLAGVSPGVAEEGGSGHYLPGSMSSFMDGVPAEETFLARYNLLYYDGDIGVSRSLPVAGLVAGGVDATSWANGLTLLWRPPINLGERWSYAFSATIPYVWLKVIFMF